VRAVSGVGRRVDLGVVLAAVTAVVIFWIAYDDGSYGLPSRAPLAIALWWAIIVGLALNLLAPRRLPRATLVVGGLIVALALWTLVSVAWAPSAEDAFNEFNRVSLYLGVYVFVVLAANRSTVGRWADGLAAAIAAVAIVALASRLLPGSFPDRGLATFLPSAATRLSFPLGYWNGLAIFVALGVPLLLRVALVARHDITRGVALVPVPAVASVVYLASSRGGVVTAFVGAFAFVLLTERRWSGGSAVVVSGLGSWLAITVLLDRDELVNGPLGTDLVRDQGRSATALIGLSCVATGVTYWLGCRLIGPRLRPGPTVGRIVAGLVALALVAGLVASDPIQRFETFKLPSPESGSIDRGDFVKAHLLSGSGSGRWQFWSVAVDEAKEYPALGEGAGAYEHWWAEHASITRFVRDAHSLYLESLGELGVLGAALVVALALAGILVGMLRSLRNRGEARVTTAALTAVFTGYAVAAGFDWMWELTVVSVVGFAALALVSGAATEVYEPLRSARPDEMPQWTSRRRYGFGIVLAVIAWALICAQVIPLLADREIARSQAATVGGDLDEASEAAESARDIQPWAATPYLQLALVGEQRGDLQQARRWIGEALVRDARDWRLWLVSARLETKLGRAAVAERSLRRAVELNPRSPLFKGLLEQ
jgi:hypothetical protein